MATPEMNAADRVRNCIKQLASITTEDASLALESLSSDNDLRPWHSVLTDATHRQKAQRREATFVYGDIDQVHAKLDCGPLANAKDLAALTFEHLHQIARNIRDGNTSDWRQYWNADQNNRPQIPRPKDACRDALLSDLRHRLMRLGIDLQLGGRNANDKRADIRDSYSGFKFPWRSREAAIAISGAQCDRS